MRTNVKHHMMALLVGRNTVTKSDDLDKWLEATVECADWHDELQREWHSRNFSQDEADEVNRLPMGFLRPEVPSVARLLAEMALDKVGVEDEE